MQDSTDSIATANPSAGKTVPASWLKKLGVAGFLFFLIKGLLWLIVPALLATRWITT